MRSRIVFCVEAMKNLFVVLSVLCLISTACSGMGGAGVTPASSPAEPSPSQAGSIQPCLTPSGSGVGCTPVPRVVHGLSGQEAQDWIEKTLAAMTLEEKVGQLILSGIDGTQISDATCEYIHQVAPGGITFRHENALDPDQLRQFSADLQACAQAGGLPPLLTAIAHEGEYVDRFWKGTTTFPAALALGATADPDLAYRTAFAQGQELAYSGVNMVLGPAADVLINFDNEVISQRTYGGDPAMVGKFVSAAVRGYMDAGVIPVLKHFPGHGGVAGDSHRLQPVDDASLDELKKTYLPPFQLGFAAGAPVVMFDHLVYPAIDTDKLPASRSSKAAQLARQDLGFQGLILTDSMRMLGVKEGTPGTPQASHLALEAGADMLLLDTPEDVLAVRTLLLDVIGQGQLDMGRIDDAVRHILALKAAQGLVDYPVEAGAAPDWAANRQLAQVIGERAVTLYKDEAGLVPIPGNVKNVLVVGPGDEWELYPMLEAGLKERGITAKFVDYPPPWDGPVQADDLLASLPDQAANYDLVLVFTWQAHLNRLDNGDTWQADLVNRLVQVGAPLVVVAIKSPTDILEFPHIGTYLVMFGSTPGQEKALLDALTGQAEPVGKNPLPGLAP